MTNALYDSFHNYVLVFQLLIEKQQEKKNESLKLTEREQEQLLFVVNEAEGRREFEDMVKATDSSFPNYNEWGVGRNSVLCHESDFDHS